MLTVNQRLEDLLQETFPDRKVFPSQGAHGFVYVTTVLTDDKDIHYEYFEGEVELHLEGVYQGAGNLPLVRKLRHLTKGDTRLKWMEWNGCSRCRCRLNTHMVDSEEQICDAFREISSILDPIIKSISDETGDHPSAEPYVGGTTLSEEGLSDYKVSMDRCTLGRLFGNKLVIPDYQRDYCWEDKQVSDLWSSLGEISDEGEYHLGTIILQKGEEGTYAIIDGQQRLVTLTLILRELGYQGDLPLLKQKFLSVSSSEHIANSRWVIKSLLSGSPKGMLCRRIIRNLTFTVLILRSDCLNLAYTFFSNENSKGVPLTDYDLLKAHHLRYISDEALAEYLAGRWDDMIEHEYPALEQTLATHLFRLRRWMRKRYYDPGERFRVRDEYATADLLHDISPERGCLDFYEKVQGGVPFFEYTEHFVRVYKQFAETRQVKTLRNYLQRESHCRYEDVIETLLFGYYLKFGGRYMTEALLCFSCIMAQHRYENGRAMRDSIRAYACRSEVVMMIDQASSPTYLLAECLSSLHMSGREVEKEGIAKRFYTQLCSVFAELEDDLSVPTIIDMYENGRL